MRGFEVIVPGKDGAPDSPSYALVPEGAQRGMVVVHEALGRQPEIDRVVERFGDAGYATIAPDLFASAPRAVCMARAVRAIASGRGPQIEQIRRARSWLCERGGFGPERVGLIGFCMGGGFALAAGPGFGAVSTNYGPVPESEVMRGIGPTIGCYGGRDRLFRDVGERLKTRLAPHGVEVETHLFPEVGHSFLTDGHHPVANLLSHPLLRIEYNPRVAEEGFRHIFAFFDRHL
jgi:carboxymethylenebutenolidase